MILALLKLPLKLVDPLPGFVVAPVLGLLVSLRDERHDPKDPGHDHHHPPRALVGTEQCHQEHGEEAGEKESYGSSGGFIDDSENV